ncbi:hypothetical protein H2203_000315 [Taxawa tesnikishii (nom. ined.)]|nr:hypothetical protein H2203_000315 [Dothideales sp. JES 119]
MYSQRPSTSNDAPRVLTPTLPYDIPHETPTQLPKTASQESIITAPKIEVLEKQPEQRDTESSQFNYPLQRCHNNIKPSIEVDGTSESPSNHSSNEVAIPSKPSKFKEDMASPPRKKLAKKRRSVFRLLFSPHSMRRRSISVPELSSARSSIVGKKFSNDAIHDGAADDRPNPTVRTLTESERYRVQSVGFADTSAAPRETQPQNTNNLTVPSLVLRRSTTAGFERENSAPAELLRRPSLADYERGLSVVGDNRRRPTGFNVQMLRDVQQDDRRLSVQRPLSRAAPLFVPSGKTGENPLMEKALQKHQLEKAALFRSSRRTSTSGTIAPAPIFSTPFASTTPSQSPSRVDQLDPLDPGEGPSNRKARSIISLHSPTTPRPASASPGKRPSAMSTTTIPGNDRPGTGMPLASWSRYPSHTRLERCESANTNDGVAVRDFCVNPSDLHLSEAIEGSTVPSRSATTPRKQKKKYWIPRSASLTFDSVVRYYSNLFTSSAARGRRSSIATGGKLEYPELELLPPVHAQSVVQQSSHSHSTPHLGRFFSREHGREGEEAHELFAMSHKPKAGTVARQMKRSSESTIGPTDGATDDDSEVKSSVRQRAATEESSDESLAPGGTADVQQQAAQQWSRWYQSCVRLPTSLNDNPADGSADALLGSSVHNIENLAASKPSSKDRAPGFPPTHCQPPQARQLQTRVQKGMRICLPQMRK